MPEADQAAALLATLRTVNEAACWVSGVAFEHGVPREYELRKHTYTELKARGLGAQAAQHVIKKTRDAYTTLKANIRAGNLGKPGSKRRVKAESKPITFRPKAAQPYDDRCLSWQYDARTVSIWTTAGRLKRVRFACSPGALKMLREHRKGESDLIERDGVFYLIAVCDAPEADQYEPHGFIGVDLGITNIVTTAERTGSGIALEDLTGIRSRVRLRKDQRTTLHSWSFHQLASFVEYKAQRAGVPLVYVDPAYTSQQCSDCGHIDRRNRQSQATFACRSCGALMHADDNASHNIGRKGETVWTAGRESRVPATP